MATKKTTQSTSDSGFSEAELAAMKERAAELRASKGGNKKAAEAERCLETIAGMNQPDRGLAERIHAIVLSEAPHLDSKTWYGFPAYARDGKVVVFFKPAEKFDSRYATLGFEEASQLDDGPMWATSYAVLEIGAAEEKLIRKLVKKAAG
ncbi:MAG TPA: hypothetical protein PLZ93_10550 [Nocardioides sp.]|uniref:iron chaperone n=1 Tax=uncultured Nocardioides sp. TaxID=198441 RepID=UPI000EDDBC49|nr:hypothetical protein [uncultured Nocardioides sp.]HCB05319.1 hypothetical protein [Nocardioides sp.]HRD62050.1 hypothetical protein [Nocardioides sp.]HRI96045.1 hypothetical protein [Nocardioides sp.]HRK48755.1 hypothetical protein [Nocardioides sp.]